jgi:hypothetical protein
MRKAYRYYTTYHLIVVVVVVEVVVISCTEPLGPGQVKTSTIFYFQYNTKF